MACWRALSMVRRQAVLRCFGTVGVVICVVASPFDDQLRAAVDTVGGAVPPRRRMAGLTAGWNRDLVVDDDPALGAVADRRIGTPMIEVSARVDARHGIPLQGAETNARSRSDPPAAPVRLAPSLVHPGPEAGTRLVVRPAANISRVSRRQAGDATHPGQLSPDPSPALGERVAQSLSPCHGVTPVHSRRRAHVGRGPTPCTNRAARLRTDCKTTVSNAPRESNPHDHREGSLPAAAGRQVRSAPERRPNGSQLVQDSPRARSRSRS